MWCILTSPASPGQVNGFRDREMGLKVTHPLRCLISEPKAAQRGTRHGAALPFHEKYRDFFFHFCMLEWNKTPLKCLVKALRRERKEKDPLLLPLSPFIDPLIAISPGDNGSFARADPEQSPSLSFRGFSCALIIPKSRASSLFFSFLFSLFFFQQFHTKNHTITSMEKHTSVKISAVASQHFPAEKFFIRNLAASSDIEISVAAKL